VLSDPWLGATSTTVARSDLLVEDRALIARAAHRAQCTCCYRALTATA
jgi:hypothetical protein